MNVSQDSPPQAGAAARQRSRAGAPPAWAPLEALYETMLGIRLFEEALLDLYRAQGLTGTTHTSVGQEAVAAGALRHLRPGDGVVSNHRCHGHYLAAGGDAAMLLDEIRGNRGGACRGVGGSQHVHFDRFFSNGILGGMIPVAAGLALADKVRRSGGVVVAFLGDGALGEGVVYETLNLAALWRLPMLFVLENNLYAQSTPQHLNLSGSIRGRFDAFGIENVTVDGNDVLAVDAAAGKLFARVRTEARPLALIADTYRLEAHSKGDDFRDPAEIAGWRARDPLARAGAALSAEWLVAAQARAGDEIARVFAAPPAGTPAPTLRDIAPDRPRAASAPAASPWRSGRRETMQWELQHVLADLLAEREDVHVLGEDLLDPYGGAFKITDGLSTRFPDRVWTTPVSEAAIVGIAGGMALDGLRPVVEIMFGDFSTLIVDQLLNHAAKFERMYGGTVSCPVIVRTPMGGRRGYGPTHSQSLEKLFLGIPGLTVVAADPVHDQGLIWRRMVELAAPCLYVENKVLYGTRLPLIEAGRCGPFALETSGGFFPTTRLRLGGPPDAAIVCYGGMVPAALEAARRLFERYEWVVDTIVPSALAPLDVDALVGALGSHYPIVVAEEGTLRSGFGAEVVAALTDRRALAGRAIRRVAMPDTIVPNNSALERELLPDTDHIVDVLCTLIA